MLDRLWKSAETAEQYGRWSAPLRSNPEALKGLLRLNRGLKILCYVLYPLLLVLTWLEAGGLAAMPPASALFWRVLIGPAAGFAIETALRAAINAPRPYEELGIDPLIKKQTRGRSFPSRHSFSVFVIATCWCFESLPLGCALLIAGAALAWVRVVGGVHHPRDVVAGAALGIACGLISCLV